MQLPESINLWVVDNNPVFSQIVRLILTNIGLNQGSIATDATSCRWAFRTSMYDARMQDINFGQSPRAEVVLGEKKYFFATFKLLPSSCQPTAMIGASVYRRVGSSLKTFRYTNFIRPWTWRCSNRVFTTE